LKEDVLLGKTRRLLGRHGLKAKKGLGQNFLIDSSVLSDIISAAELAPDDTIVEVGPGLGVLTSELVKRVKKVAAVELDDKLAAILKTTLSEYGNFTVHNEDILKIAPADIIAPAAKYKVVANLPYYITSMVVRHFLEASIKPQTMIIMVQKEVAKVITAKPGNCSLLSISVQFYGQAEIVRTVPAECFYPKPEVDSAVLKITTYPTPPLPIADADAFFGLVKAGFTASRKQLPNSLAQGLKIEKPKAAAMLEKAKIAPKRRAETLTIAEWCRLFEVFEEGKEG